MSNYWSRDDKLFVDGELEVLSFNLSLANSPSQSLPMERRSDFIYDGPKGDDFKDYLSKNDFRVNRKGRVIVVVPGRDERVEAFRYFLLDKVVPLLIFGFKNSRLSKFKEVVELQSLLDNSKAELEKKNDELNESQKQLDSIKTELMDKITVMKKEVMESQSRLNETEAELAKKNYQVSESQRQLEDLKTALMKKSMEDPQLAKFSPFRVLGDLSNIFEFLRRMNGTYVNSEGIYIKLDFIGAKSSGPWVTTDNSHYHYQSGLRMTDSFSFVQFDWNKHAMNIQERQVVLPQIRGAGGYIDAQLYVEATNGIGTIIAFTFKEFCFIGRVKRVSDTFLENALVGVFFEQTKHDKNNCYVDALATTFFVLKSKDVYWRGASKAVPRFIS